MKKKIIFLIFLFFSNFSNLVADDRNTQLERLFNDLKNENYLIASEVEQEIWKIWSTHPKDDDLTSLLAEGTNFVNINRFNSAINIFTEVINLDPSWAEAWNKRATVLYLVGEYQKSQNDIDKVLKLEKRHFGALAGQGLVNIQLENYEKAIKSYEKAREIYPSMKSPNIMIDEIKEMIKKKSI